MNFNIGELDPAVMGFIGVVIGVFAAQLGDWLRWRRGRAAALEDRQQVALLALLRHTAVAVGSAATVVDMLQTHQAGTASKLTIDTTQLDEACTGGSVATDELRVLGPDSLIEPAVDLLIEVLDVRESAMANASPAALQLVVARVYEAKLRLLEEAARHDLAAASAGSTASGDRRARLLRRGVVSPGPK